MFAAKDAVTCMRKSYTKSSPISFVMKGKASIDILNYFITKFNTFLEPFCRPLRAHNIFSNLLITSKNESISDNSVVVLASRLDSFSMFSGISPGADSALTSVISLLSVVHTLNQIEVKNGIKQMGDKKNVLFALFDGEAFDYIGSSSVVFNMNANKFPEEDPIPSEINDPMDISSITCRHISHFIELNQLSFHSNDSKLFIHKNLDSNDKLNSLQNLIKDNANGLRGLEVESVSDGQPLPPSSLQSFLKDNESLIGIVIANHRKEYTNKF